jgi:putative ABC transport system permease protein
MQDLRYAVRSLRQSPGFALAAVLTLALGIGANTAIFSVINSILFRPYPYTEPDDLVVLRSMNQKSDVESGGLSFNDFVDLREQNKVFKEIGLVRTRTIILSGSDKPLQMKGAEATPSLFQVIGGRALAGRTFLPSEGQPGGSKVVVLSQRLWERELSADPDIVGKTIQLDSQPFVVIGIVPPSAQFPDIDAAELFIPLSLDPAKAERQRRSFIAMARLNPRVSVANAQAEISGIANRLEREYPDTNKSWGVRVITLREYRTDRFKALSTILFGVVAFVLLIACANVANLLLQRAGARQREIAIRSAIGAARSRVVAQLLTESLLLAVLGGLLGLLLSAWGLQLLVAAIPQELPSYMNNFGVDGKVLAYMGAISVLTAILFGLFPALQVSKPNLTETLGDAGARSSGGTGKQRMRKALVMAQIALSVILLIAAGLMIKSFRRLQEADPGFNPKNALTLQISLPGIKYAEPHQRTAFFKEATSRLASVAGVEAVGLTNDLPIGNGVDVPFGVDGQSEEERKDNGPAIIQFVSGDFFKALSIPIVQGRAFDQQDFGDVQGSIIVNTATVRRFWPDGDPLGKRMQLDLPGDDDPWLTVVGIVGDARGGPQRRETPFELYVPYPLRPVTAFSTMDVVVRTTAGDPLTAASPLRSQLQALDPDLPIVSIRPLDQVLSESMWLQKISGMLFGVFAVVALLLAAIGMYGTAAYSVSQRTREIGIRMALGARAQDVLKMVLRQGAVTTAIALAVGLGGAFGLSRLLGRLLYGVKSTDPAIFLFVTLMVAGVALLANYIPARRATKVPPVSALKYD